MITTTENKTIVALANELANSLIRKTRSNGEEFTCFKDGLDSVAPWIQEAVCSLMDFPNDTYYDLIARVASFISEQDEASDFDDIQDLLYELEPDCYTSDLTAWLNASIDHVYYLGEVLKHNHGITDGCALLSQAQALQIEEVASGLLNLLNEISEAE
jgi:hypothetical protein